MSDRMSFEISADELAATASNMIVELFEVLEPVMKGDAGVRWQDEIDFWGAALFLPTTTVDADGTKLKTETVLLHAVTMPIITGDLVRRKRDGEHFRVTGGMINGATYEIDGKTYVCVPVERCEKPEMLGEQGGEGDAL